MSKIQKINNNINNNNLVNKKHLETNIRSNIIHHLLTKKSKLTNINKLFLKSNNYSFTKNKRPIHKNILTEELLSQKIIEKKINNSNIKTHRKSPTNIYDINSYFIKSETNSDIKKLAEKRIFEYKIHKRIQAEKQTISINKKRNKIGNRYVLINTRNFKKNEGYTTEYIFEGNNDKHNENNSLQNSTNLTIDSNRTFQKKKFVKKILNPLLTINNDYRNKNINNHCLKSCNLETNHYSTKKRKIYSNRGRNIKTENIFKTQSKFKNNSNYYSSLDNSTSNNINHKSKYFLNPKKKNIEITSKLGQSFDLPKNSDFLSSSNSNIRSFSNILDDKFQSKTVNLPRKKTTTQNLSNNILIIEKPNKKSSNIDLKKVFLYKIKNIFKDNFLNNNKFLSINKNKLIKKANLKANESKSLMSRNTNLTTKTSNKKIKMDKTKSSEKNKKPDTKQFLRNIKEKEKILEHHEHNHFHEQDSLQIKDSIKIKNPLLNLNIKLNMDSKTKIKELLKQNKVIKIPKNNVVIKPKNPIFQSKEIIKIKTLSKKGFWQPGKEKDNQDNLFILKNINGNDKYYYMGVCDGHGIYGKEVSNFIINNLPQNLNKNIINNKIKYLSFEPLKNLSKLIINTFIQTDNELINNQNINTYLSGSTCVSILYTSRRIISINLGDSRCILGKYNGEKWMSKDLSRDHRPNKEDEKKRIILNGGRVEKNKDDFGNDRGPLRIWMKDEDSPGLAVSRSFGDELAHKIGVISEPEINEYVFLYEDKFFILASDGLWEYISSEECVNIVKNYYMKNDIDGAINNLYKESSKRWITQEDIIDDITMIIVFMN